MLELSPQVLQHTALLVQFASLTVNGPECLFPEPDRLLPTLHGASGKHVLSGVVQDLYTPTDRRRVRREPHFARLIHHLQAPGPEHVRYGWYGLCREVDAKHPP